ncbi:MAG: hypothetical protein KGD57_03640 [Candidatus Lokiarchaeota archaeon]|nr:hypothetical protein [Candidatus Lokiarchaeota archaeon]
MNLFSNKTQNQNAFSSILNSINALGNKYKAPLILQMFGALNKFNLKTENRYILCNFLDQYSDLIGLKNNIYIENNEKSLNQLFLLAYKKAKEAKLLNELYQEYSNSIKAICQKIEMKSDK